MVFYRCPRCGYNSVIKNDIRRHVNRKKGCEAVYSDIILKDLNEDELFDILKSNSISENDILKNKNEKLKNENELLKKEIEKLKNENELLKNRNELLIKTCNVISKKFQS